MNPWKRSGIFSLIVFCGYLLANHPALAQSSLEDELKEMKSQMATMQSRMNTLEEKVAAQNKQISQQEESKQASETRIKDLEQQLAQHPAVTSQPVVESAKPAMTKWIPEIGGVADVVYRSASNQINPDTANRLSLREFELVLGSQVDPYTRLDATISFSDTENPSIEEGYLTYLGLPGDLTGRIGKFKPKIGKTLPNHRDSLDTVDEPLVIQRYFGEEGYNKAGADVTKILDLPWPVTQQVTVGVLEGGNGDGGSLFGDDVRNRPTLYSHLKNYVDLNDDTGLELGFSHLAGAQEDSQDFDVQVLGVDTTLKHNFNANQNIKLQGEGFHIDRQDTGDDFKNHLWGAYALADVRLAPQWSTGIRYDYVQTVDNDRTVNPFAAERGYSGYLTFYQSEFARWRLQVSHNRLETGQDDNEVLLQGTFAMGEHKHKIQ